MILLNNNSIFRPVALIKFMLMSTTNDRNHAGIEDDTKRIQKILHECSCFIEFIKQVEEKQ